MKGRGLLQKYSYLCVQSSGLGDDLALYWALIAGRLSGLFPDAIGVYFESREIRSYLSEHLQPIFPEASVLRDPGPLSRHSIVVRLGSKKFRFGTLLSGFRLGNDFSSPYFNRFFSEFRPKSEIRLNVGTRMAVMAGILSGKVRVWPPPYDAAYNGYQELAVSFGFKKKDIAADHERLSAAWPQMRERIANRHAGRAVSGSVGIFPSANSFQRFPGAVIRELRRAFPAAKVYSHSSFPDESTDATYDHLGELQGFLLENETAITSDSASSHLAQFISARHILICSRSRPVNVCFPGAANTTVIDMGRNLTCRPCDYYKKNDENLCPMQRKSCDAFLDLSMLERVEQSIRRAR
jgi:hypothetical protein